MAPNNKDTWQSKIGAVLASMLVAGIGWVCTSVWWAATVTRDVSTLDFRLSEKGDIGSSIARLEKNDLAQSDVFSKVIERLARIEEQIREENSAVANISKTQGVLLEKMLNRGQQ